MLVELAADLAADTVDRTVDDLARHEDVIAWPIRLRGRVFVVVSGDQRLVPPVDPAVCLRVWDTSRTGYALVTRDCGAAPAAVPVGVAEVGSGRPLWAAAGPCALESYDDTLATAERLAAAGVSALRMGLFKPRSSPYHFTGKGRAGLPMLADIREAVGLPVVTEVLDPRDVESVAEVADCLQVDTRNMTNRALLTEVGAAAKPVLLMRGLRSTVGEWLRAAEFVMSRGNPRVIMCARGIASFDDSLAFAPDYGALLAVRRHTDLPLVFDPSHSTGRADAVAAAAVAATAFGADGLLIESHIAPERCYQPGDGAHMYPPERIAELLTACAGVRDGTAAVRTAPLPSATSRL